jgi:glutaredoxin-like protein NrdH
MKKITVYTTPNCSQCNLTKKWLDDPKRGDLKGQYDVIDLSQDAEAYEAVKALGYAAAPVVIVGNPGANDDETHWYGFRPDMLKVFVGIPSAAAA